MKFLRLEFNIKFAFLNSSFYFGIAFSISTDELGTHRRYLLKYQLLQIGVSSSYLHANSQYPVGNK